MLHTHIGGIALTNSTTRHAVLGGWLECAFSQDAPTNFKITNQGPAPHLVLGFLFVETLMPKGLQRQSHLVSPSGLRADDAAAYLGMGKTKFLELVDKGKIPRAFTIDSIKIWDRFDLDAVIDAAKEDTPTENNSSIKSWGDK